MKTLTYAGFTIAFAIGVLAVSLLFTQSQTALGGGWLGLQTHIQSATTTTVGTTVTTVFADEVSPICHSRIITTTGGAIMLSFDDVTGHGSTTISGSVGHWQGASTTVAYDAGTYGCGLLSAYGYSSTTITISSF